MPFRKNINSIKKQMRSYIAGLPSILEAKENYDTVFSDHLPVLTTIPSENEKLKEIKIISWNVLEVDGGNGFAPNEQINYGEEEHEQKNRHIRIANSLGKFTKDYQPQFIALQEIQFNENEESLFQLIKKNLGENYACQTDTSGCITFYRKDQFNPTPYNKDDEKKLPRGAGGNVTNFQLANDSDYEVRFANVHHGFSENTTSHEATIEEFLSGQYKDSSIVDKTKRTKLIMCGDFNGTMANLDDRLRKNTTSVSPSAFRMIKGVQHDPEIQKAWDEGIQVQGAWGIIDGFFHSTLEKNQEKDFIYHQATITPLNPITGLPHTKKELAPLSIKGLPLLQQKEIMQYRMVICVDHSYQKDAVLEIKKELHSIYTYQRKLQNEFNGEIRVRRAANLNNEKGIGIILTRELYNYFFLLNKPNFSLTAKVDNTGAYTFTIYASDKNIPRLVREMQFAADNKYYIDKIAKLDQANAKLKNEMKEKAEREKVKFDQTAFEQAQKVDTETINAFKRLFAAVGNEPNRQKQPYTTIVEHFSGLADRLLQNEKITIEEVQKSADELDAKLATKKPMSKNMRMIIGGLIGALVGLAIGAAVGFALSAWAGGFGAIPGMVIGAAQGAGIGVAALGGTVAGFGLGSLAGEGINFFSSKDTVHKPVNREKENTFKALTEHVKKTNKPK